MIIEKSHCCEWDVYEHSYDTSPPTSRCKQCQDNCMVLFFDNETGEKVDYFTLFVDDYTGALHE